MRDGPSRVRAEQLTVMPLTPCHSETEPCALCAGHGSVPAPGEMGYDWLLIALVAHTEAEGVSRRVEEYPE